MAFARRVITARRGKASLMKAFVDCTNVGLRDWRTIHRMLGSGLGSLWFPHQVCFWPALPPSRAQNVSDEIAGLAEKAGGGVDIELDSLEIQETIRLTPADALPRVGESDLYQLVTRAFSYARIITRIRQPFLKERPAVRTTPEDLREGLFLVLKAKPNGALAEATAHSNDVHEKYHRFALTKRGRSTIGHHIGGANRLLVVAVKDERGKPES